MCLLVGVHLVQIDPVGEIDDHGNIFIGRDRLKSGQQVWKHHRCERHSRPKDRKEDSQGDCRETANCLVLPYSKTGFSALQEVFCEIARLFPLHAYNNASIQFYDTSSNRHKKRGCFHPPFLRTTSVRVFT